MIFRFDDCDILLAMRDTGTHYRVIGQAAWFEPLASKSDAESRETSRSREKSTSRDKSRTRIEDTDKGLWYFFMDLETLQELTCVHAWRPEIGFSVEEQTSA
jgi:hypothetical protein